MGNASSSQLLEGKEALLARLAGTERIDTHDNFWIEFFDFKSAALTRADPWELAKRLEPFCVGLESNNTATHNFQTMLLRMADTVKACKSLTSVPYRAINAMALTQLFVEHSNAHLSHAEREAFVQDPEGVQPAKSGPQAARDSVIRVAIRALTEFLSSAAPTEHAYLAMMQATRLLLTMCDTQLYTTLPCAGKGAHPYTEALVDECSTGTAAARLTEALLKRVVERFPAPPGTPLWEPPTPQESAQGTLSYLTGAVASVALAPVTAVRYSARAVGLLSGDAGAAHLATESLRLLLVLLHHAPFGGKPNPFRASIRALRDAAPARAASAVAAELGAGGGPGDGVPRVPFAGLFDAVCQHLDTELATLLLYSLLHGSRLFLDHVLKAAPLSSLLVLLLHSLYSVDARSTSQMYLLLIVLLILTQSPHLTEAIHKEKVPLVPWFKERMLANIPLESLMFLVLMRCAHFNVVKLKDEFVQNNTQAVLANLAPTLQGLVPYAAQRLMVLVDLYARKIEVLANKLTEAVGAAREESPEGLVSQLGVYRSSLNVLLEIINNTLRRALTANPELVYALLLKQEVVGRAAVAQEAACRASGAGAEELEATGRLLANIEQVVGFFQAAVDADLRDKLESQRTVEDVMGVIRGRLDGPLPPELALRHEVAELTFSYEEEASPEDFFVPYVWSVVVETSSHLPAPRDRIQIFSPAAAGDGGKGDEGGTDEGVDSAA